MGSACSGWIKKHLSDTDTIIMIYCAVAVAATVHKVILPSPVLNGHVYAGLPNYAIFRNAFFHLVNGKDLYAAAPLEQWDFFKYSPAFALLMGPMALLPYNAGVVLWNLLNAAVLGVAIRSLPNLRSQEKAAILWFVLPPLLGSIQNAQSNALMAGLMLAGFTWKHRGNESLSSLCIILSVYVKLFGAVALVLWLIYPRKIRFASWCLFWTAILAALPLSVVPPKQLIFLYESWGRLLQMDHAGDSTVSAMGVLKNWFGLGLSSAVIVLIGVLLLLIPLIRKRSDREFGFGLLLTSSILIWVVIFNHKAEPPTFVIAVTGVAIWYFTQTKRIENTLLVALVLVFCSLSSTDLFPREWKDHFFKPYGIKVVPCILVWLKIQYELTFNKSHWKTRSGGTLEYTAPDTPQSRDVI